MLIISVCRDHHSREPWLTSSPQRHLVPTRRGQLVRRWRTYLAIFPSRTVQLVPHIPSHFTRRHLLLPLKRLPCRRTLRATRDSRSERLRTTPVLVALYHWYCYHLGWRGILASLGYRSSPYRWIQAREAGYHGHRWLE